MDYSESSATPAPSPVDPAPVDPSPVIDLVEAFRRSKTMFAAVSLGVFDLLERAPGNLATIALELRVKSDPLERLLDTCVGLKLLRRNGGLYENERVASTYLCRRSKLALTGYILYSNGVHCQMWSQLEDAVREGTQRGKHAIDIESGIFVHFVRA